MTDLVRIVDASRTIRMSQRRALGPWATGLSGEVERSRSHPEDGHGIGICRAHCEAPGLGAPVAPGGKDD
jgi:hypothetical protein